MIPRARPYIPQQQVSDLPQGYQGFLELLTEIATTLDNSAKWEKGPLSPAAWKKYMETEVTPLIWSVLLTEKNGRQKIENLVQTLSKDLGRAQQKFLSGNIFEPNFPSMERYFLNGFDFPAGIANVSKQVYRGRSLLHKLSLKYFCKEMEAKEKALVQELESVQLHFRPAQLLNTRGQALHRLRSAIKYDDEKDRYFKWTSSVSTAVEKESTRQANSEEVRISRLLSVVALLEVLAVTVLDYGNKLNLKVLVGGILPTSTEFSYICMKQINLDSLDRSLVAQPTSTIVSPSLRSSQTRPLALQTRPHYVSPYAPRQPPDSPASTPFSPAFSQFSPITPAHSSPLTSTDPSRTPYTPVGRTFSPDRGPPLVHRAQTFPASGVLRHPPHHTRHSPYDATSSPRRQASTSSTREVREPLEPDEKTYLSILGLYHGEGQPVIESVVEKIQDLMKGLQKKREEHLESHNSPALAWSAAQNVKIYLDRWSRANQEGRQIPRPDQIPLDPLEVYHCNVGNTLIVERGGDHSNYPFAHQQSF